MQTSGLRRRGPRRYALYSAAQILSGAPIMSRTMTFVWLGLCYQMMVTDPAVAGNRKTTEKPSSLERRAAPRIGVSVTVLPTCAIRLDEAAGTAISQPVEIRCTRNARYGVGLAEGSGQLASGGSGGALEPSVARFAKQSNGRADVFVLEKARISEQSLPNGHAEVTVLAIDF